MFSMTNYYYIVASLPAISQDWKFGDRTAQGLINEIKGQSTAKDLALIEFVERSFDDGNLGPDFYRQALSHRNRFIREYYAFDLEIRNAKVRYLNSALGRETGRDEISLSDSTFESREPFCKEAELDAILHGKDILARERNIDNLYWNMLDELTVQHYFDMDVILAFILKLHIIDRWHLLDEQTGREMFRKLVDEVRGTFKGVDYNPGTAGAPEGSPARTDNN